MNYRPFCIKIVQKEHFCTSMDSDSIRKPHYLCIRIKKKLKYEKIADKFIIYHFSFII